MTRTRTTTARSLLAVTTAALGLTLGAAGVAFAAPSEPPHDVTLLDARVVANGAKVKVEFTVTCPAGTTWNGSMLTLQAVPYPYISDVLASTGGDQDGRCKGKPQKVKLTLVNRGTELGIFDPVTGELIGSEPAYVPLHSGCGIEYGVTFYGENWDVAFDVGGADGGPDGPGPALCFD
jgi:hypothetical protein